MTCTKTVKEYSEAAGRKVEFCRELDGAADGTLGGFGLGGKLRGFAMDGGHLKWWTGLPIGAGAHYLAKYVINYYNQQPTTTPILQTEWQKGLPGLAVGAILAIFKKTRTAGLAALGTGIALTAVGAVTSTALSGLPVAEMGRAPVKILTGATGGLGLPVAEEMSGAPVEVLTGSNAFGTSLGSNFFRR